MPKLSPELAVSTKSQKPKSESFSLPLPFTAKNRHLRAIFGSICSSVNALGEAIFVPILQGGHEYDLFDGGYY
jgi:hypothetical protein